MQLVASAFGAKANYSYNLTMINQLSLNQFVNAMSNYSTEKADEIRKADSETSDIMRIKHQVAVINRETAHINATGDSPPTWKMDYKQKLNVI